MQHYNYPTVEKDYIKLVSFKWSLEFIADQRQKPVITYGKENNDSISLN